MSEDKSEKWYKKLGTGENLTKHTYVCEIQI